MIPAGQRDRRVVFYPVQSDEDALGVEAETRGTGVPAFARVLFGNGQERRDAGAAGAVQMATFRVLSTVALRALDERAQIEFDGAFWGVASIAAVGAQGAELEFTARWLGRG